MKRFFKYLAILIIVIVLVLIILTVFSYFNRQLIQQRNTPVWSSEQSVSDSVDITINDKKSFHLSTENNSLVLNKNNNSASIVLFPTYKNDFESVEVYLKDIDQNGHKELIAVTLNEVSADIHVFYNMDQPDTGRYYFKEAIWVGDRILFTEDESLYIQSCGSQYCNDTYYQWTENRLKSLGTDSYESW